MVQRRELGQAPSDRARQTASGTTVSALEHLPERILAGITSQCYRTLWGKISIL